jgi:hypothetical protein
MFKRMTISFLAASLGLAVLVPLNARPAPQDPQKAMDAYMKAGAVTENHAYLNRFAGSWTARTTMWTVPGQPPSTSENMFEGKMILGGRFVSMAYIGTMMGRPFEGVQISGYDNMQKKYVTLWLDDTSTSFFLLAGARDAVKDILNQTGEWADPLGGMTKVRAATRFLNPNEYVFEQFMILPDGKELKSMEMRCTRKK